MQIILFTDVADTLGYGKYAGTYKIATEIRNAGYTCQVVDLFSKFTYPQLEKIIDKFVTSETILIGFSCTLMEKRIGLQGSKNSKVYNFGRPNEEVISLLNRAKNKNPRLKVVVGGARINNQSCWKFIDYAIVNKGDVAIIKLIEHILYGSNLPATKVDPTIILDGSSPDYFYTQDQFKVSKILFEPQDIILKNEALPIEVARGCIFSCAYCRFDLIGKKIGDWQKAEQALYDEIIRNYELYGTTHYMVSDELINESLPKMELIHKVFTNLPFKISFNGYARLDLIHAYPQMRDMLQESGAASLAFGIETMNDNAGKKIGKGLGKQRTIDTLNFCSEKWKNKVMTSSQFIVGLPYEDESSIMKTLDWLVSDECPLDVFGFLPLYIRGESDGRNSSKIDRDPKKYGYILHEDKPWENNNMTFDEACRLVVKLYNDPRVEQKVKFGVATWVGRILNVGFNMDDLFYMLKNPDLTKSVVEGWIKEKEEEKNNEYYFKLMAI